jgi:predicted metal-dependent hydrolase
MGEVESSHSKQRIEEEEVAFCRRRNARRYIASLDHYGRIRVTIPQGGTSREALKFVRENGAWLREQQRKREELLESSKLKQGDEIWYRGDKHTLGVSKDWGRPVMHFADQRIFLSDENIDLARPLGIRFRLLARKELPERTRQLASRFELLPSKVSIRDQRTRWGSCSSSGVISLNWRLIMVPNRVVDYIIIHELMHMLEMNHSHRFWKLVEAACPEYREHESWLESNHSELGWG